MSKKDNLIAFIGLFVPVASVVLTYMVLVPTFIAALMVLGTVLFLWLCDKKLWGFLLLTGFAVGWLFFASFPHEAMACFATEDTAGVPACLRAALP